MRKTMAWLLAAMALCVSCKQVAEGRQTYRQLLALRDQITKEFGETNVDVVITNGDRLTVKFINSPFNARSHAEKQERADAVAALAVKHYKQPLAAVSTQFVTQRGGGGVSAAVRQTFIGRLPASAPASRPTS